ncbi:MAG: hypothetical protein ACMVO3_02575 [Thalassobaculum sp.]
MSVLSETPDSNGKEPPKSAEDMWAQRRGKNLAILWTIVALAVLFFVITILRMS